MVEWLTPIESANSFCVSPVAFLINVRNPGDRAIAYGDMITPPAVFCISSCKGRERMKSWVKGTFPAGRSLLILRFLYSRVPLYLLFQNNSDCSPLTRVRECTPARFSPSSPRTFHHCTQPACLVEGTQPVTLLIWWGFISTLRGITGG